ncbi:hypothetical protein P355_4648 [Burkholderia cenocepacia KC-01]|nr:hypothetical protein P355_4648 [Burkholderia cenocepacia KC-01]
MQADAAVCGRSHRSSTPPGRFRPPNRRRMREQRSLSPQQINVSESLR